MGKFVEYINYKNTFQGKNAVIMNEIQRILNETLGRTKRSQGRGLNDIQFEPINQVQGKEGIQLNVEAKGSAIALTGNEQAHVGSMLKNLENASREELWEHHIFLTMRYDGLYVTDTKHESVGDAEVFYHIPCAIVIFTS